MNSRIPRVLSIAGTDPTGGAGLHADLKSIAAAGGYAMAATTALVAQNTQGVRDILAPDVDFLRAQLEAVFDDVEVDAVKIGMLTDSATIAVVRQVLQDRKPAFVVLDPVMVATSGDRLLEPQAEQDLRDFAPEVDIITPNIPELAVLCNAAIPTSFQEALDLAQNFAAKTHTLVIVKGGHLNDKDAGNSVVYPDGSYYHIPSVRVNTKNTHGTGCSLSSALATRLAFEQLNHPTHSSHEVVNTALKWVTHWLYESICAADKLSVGKAHGPIDHFARARRFEKAGSAYPWSVLVDAAQKDTDSYRIATGLSTKAPAPKIAPAGNWTRALWEASGDIWFQIMDLPFIQHLQTGDLEEDLLIFYLDQDAQYLSQYSRALASLAVRAPQQSARKYWATAAQSCLTNELLLHQTWLKGQKILGVPSPITLGYTNLLLANTNLFSYVVGAATVLPCFWLYAEIGLELAAHNSPEHPYRAWLETYGSKEFTRSVSHCLKLIEDAFEKASPAERAEATKAYLTASMYEYEFFDQAHRALR